MNRHSHIIAATHLKKFVFGGQATFTVVSESTGKRLTFQIMYPKKKIINQNGKEVKVIDRESVMWVSVLTGNDNTSSYSYIGFINKSKTAFVHGGEKTRIGRDAVSVLVITKMIKLISEGEIPKNATFYHEGSCGICGRMLTVPKSILTGIGPDCDQKYDDKGQRIAKERRRKIAYILGREIE
jgi:hypothetical protein